MAKTHAQNPSFDFKKGQESRRQRGLNRSADRDVCHGKRGKLRGSLEVWRPVHGRRLGVIVHGEGAGYDREWH